MTKDIPVITDEDERVLQTSGAFRGPQWCYKTCAAQNSSFHSATTKSLFGPDVNNTEG